MIFPLGAEELDTKQPAPEEMAEALGIQLPRLRWLLADIWWVFDKPTEQFESLAIAVTIDRDIPDTYNLYIVPVGIAQINGLKLSQKVFDKLQCGAESSRCHHFGREIVGGGGGGLHLPPGSGNHADQS